MQQWQLDDQDFDRGKIQVEKDKIRFSMHLKKEQIAPLFIDIRDQFCLSDPNHTAYEYAQKCAHIHGMW